MRVYSGRLFSLISWFFAVVALFTICQSNTPASAGWQTETLEEEGIVGVSTSLALDASDNPAISYLDWQRNDLMYAHFNGTSWDISTVDNMEHLGITYDVSPRTSIATGKGKMDSGTSLTFDSSGNPAISYYDPHEGDLMYAHFNGTSWDISTVDSLGNVGEYSSLAFDPFGNPSISYYGNKDLKFAYYNGSSWDIAILDDPGDIGQDTSLAYSAAGLPSISYHSFEDLKVARHDGLTWNLTTVDTSGDHTGVDTSLAFDASDNPAVSYQDDSTGDLKYAHFNGSSWDISTVDTTGSVGAYTSLAFDSSGNPAISYHDSTNADLKFAHFNGATWDITTIDSTGYTGLFTSLAIDASNNMLVSYFDWTCNDLRFARLAECKCPEGGLMGCISGFVTKVGTGEPLEGKTVRLKRTSPKKPRVKKKVVTNADGCYLFTDLEDGTYKVQVKKCKGGGSQTKTVTSGGKVNDVNFECK